MQDLANDVKSYTKMYVDDYQNVELGMLSLGKDVNIEDIVAKFVEVWKDKNIYTM